MLVPSLILFVAQYNTPAQLGPTASPFPHHNEHRLPGSPYTDSGRPSYAPRLHTIPAYPNDILILASDGLSDNLWDAEILDEVTRVRQSLGFSSAASLQSWPWSELGNGTQELTSKLRMSAFPTILAEALTSRAHRRIHSRQKAPFPSETPFTARARAAGKPVPKGGAGKNDGMSDLNLVIFAGTDNSVQISLFLLLWFARLFISNYSPIFSFWFHRHAPGFSYTWNSHVYIVLLYYCTMVIRL